MTCPNTTPEGSDLKQNYPNPFNPSTTIRFSLAERGNVHLLVFDVQGRLVAKLIDGPLTPGPHQIRWSGVDQAGNPVASGVYYYRLEAPDYSLARKMVLLR